MSSNKNALIRYKILDSCFRNPGKRYFIGDLIQACESMLAEIDPETTGISRRQIFNDIEFMENAKGWSIELERHKDGKKVFYRYKDPAFSINNTPLNQLEISELKDAMDILMQFKGMADFEWVNELVPKIRQGLSLRSQEKKIMDFESNKILRDKNHLEMIYLALRKKTPLKISYQVMEDKAENQIIIHPYFFKQNNGSWFLFGLNTETGKSNWKLAVDHILEVESLSIPYIENTAIDWNDYYEDSTVVTKSYSGQPQSIKLHFFGKTGKTIENKPLHDSQRSKWLNGQILEVDLEVFPNHELERLVLSYAESVKVIKPVSFRVKIFERLKKSFEQYI